MFGIREKVADTAKRAGLLSGGLLLCVVGLAFLTAAVWLALLPVVGAPLSALIIAFFYLGIGLIMMAAASRKSHSTSAKKEPEQPAAPDAPPVMQAFLFGVQAGARANKARRS